MKRLKAFLGDTVTIYMDSNGELIVYPATIKAILRTKIPDHHIGFGGLGLIGSDSNFEDFLQENNIPYQYVMFGSGSTDIFQFDRKIYKKISLPPPPFWLSVCRAAVIWDFTCLPQWAFWQYI